MASVNYARQANDREEEMGNPATNIRALAGMHGLSQLQLAEAIGVSRQAVKGWLSGSTPSAKHAYALATFFSIPNSDLLLWGDTAEVLVTGARAYHSAPARGEVEKFRITVESP